MKVSITWEDIRAGKSMSPTECMMARALKRELGVDYVSVGLRDVRIRIDERYVTLLLPAQLSSKIRLWERFHFILPFSFDFPGLALGLGRIHPVSSGVKSLEPAGAVTASPAVAY